MKIELFVAWGFKCNFLSLVISWDFLPSFGLDLKDDSNPIAAR